jgi:hypothetical protein
MDSNPLGHHSVDIMLNNLDLQAQGNEVVNTGGNHKMPTPELQNTVPELLHVVIPVPSMHQAAAAAACSAL